MTKCGKMKPGGTYPCDKPAGHSGLCNGNDSETTTVDMMFQIAWLNARPYCWCASVDGGKTWTKLKSDNDEDSSEPIDEAAMLFGTATNQWDLLDEPITKLNKE